jgi:hypothetical protein
VLLVTMHLSTVEVLHLTDSEAFEPPMSIRFASLESPPTIMDVGGFLESSCDAVTHEGGSHEGGSSGTLVYDGSEK